MSHWINVRPETYKCRIGSQNILLVQIESRMTVLQIFTVECLNFNYLQRRGPRWTHKQIHCEKIWRYQRGNQRSYIEKGSIIQRSNGQIMIYTALKTQDSETRTPLKVSDSSTSTHVSTTAWVRTRLCILPKGCTRLAIDKVY